jgi:hypothetical protein
MLAVKYTIDEDVDSSRTPSITFPQLILSLPFFFPAALQSLKDLCRLTCRRFLELFRHMVGLLGRVISPSQGLYLHRTTHHRKTRTNIHALSGIRTHDPSNQPAKTHASDRTALWPASLPFIQHFSFISLLSILRGKSRLMKLLSWVYVPFSISWPTFTIFGTNFVTGGQPIHVLLNFL